MPLKVLKEDVSVSLIAFSVKKKSLAKTLAVFATGSLDLDPFSRIVLQEQSPQKMPLEDVSGSLIAFSFQEEIIGKNIGRFCYWKLRFRPF